MNDSYELLIESQDVQLIVTEGIVSGSKKLIHICHSLISSFLHYFFFYNFNRLVEFRY